MSDEIIGAEGSVYIYGRNRVVLPKDEAEELERKILRRLNREVEYD